MYITNEGFFHDIKRNFTHEEKKDLKEDRGCAMDAFFREQQKKVPWLRSAGAMLVCRCKKCTGKVIC